ncbi:PREDICTED: Retrovirus-related Pol poly from transposon TNT [Prunus dulcis]|uniref:PREDICTED: Retrovirus-related Pol poly from transposon TNT n=1 Tax=Prunus dulcis TaxID=3755 RepID=A0A5E4FA34_PRUDU|nr:PREDICTED: Retrovirus-related Pol poly from transposon TNT [Prunus dulcis]
MKDESASTQQHLHVVLVCKEIKPATMTYEEWDVLDELARGATENYLANEVLINVMNDTVKQTWEKLKEMFAGKSLSNKLFLKEELLNLRMEEGGNLMEHLSSFNRKVTLDFESVVQDIMSHQRMNQSSGEKFQREGLVAKTGERGRSKKREGKKCNRGRSKSKTKEGCFEYRSKEH